MLFPAPSTLRQGLSPTDTSWEFSVHDFAENNSSLIKVVVFYTGVKSKWSTLSLRFETAPQTRITRNEPFRRLVLVRFGNFRLASSPSSPPESIRITTEYIEKFLKTGLVLNGERYHFFGHSQNQWKSRSCYLYAASKEVIAAKIAEAADLTHIRTAAKQAKRIGLLFVEATIIRDLQPAKCQDIDDIVVNGSNFTDGCGFISQRFATEIARCQRIIYRNKRYVPSVFQIRYRGYKGVLSVNPSLGPGVEAQFCKSMKKFGGGKDLAFLLTECAKPYTFGHLNDEIAILLHCLGIDREILLDKQKTYIQLLCEALRADSRSAFTVLSFLNEYEAAETLLVEGFQKVKATIKKIVEDEIARMLNKASKYRCRILVPKSRLLFGIADPSQQSGQSARIPPDCCFVRITNVNGQAMTLCNAQVLVTRNPCLHPGDLRKLTAIDVPELAHLVDCIVFSTMGDRSVADTMAGGDLDGDRFFVCWDEDLIPPNLSQPARYPPPVNHPKLLPITSDDRVEHFARDPAPILGQLRKLCYSWAKLKGLLSAECQQINRLFSHSVDGGKIKIPPELEQPPKSEKENTPFILDDLHTAAMSELKNRNKEIASDGIQEQSLLEALLYNDLLAMSEFELIKMTLSWCRRNDTDFMDYANEFDYNNLDDNEQTWLLTQIPPSRTFPGLVKNALLQSNVLLPEQLVPLRLDHPRIHWRCVFESSSDRLDRFLEATSHAFELFKHKLIVIRPDDRMALAIYCPQTVRRNTEAIVDDKVRVFTFLYTQEPNSENATCTATKQNYRLYCDESKFQLYQGTTRATFVFLTQSGQDETKYRHIRNERSRCKVREEALVDQTSYACRASIDLNRINQRVQRHIGAINRNGIAAAEIYAISDRDAGSLRMLDLWLNYVDTRVEHPLFEQGQTTRRTSDGTSHDNATTISSLQHILDDQTLESVKELSTLDSIDELLDVLLRRDEVVRVRSVFASLLDHKSRPSSTFESTTIARFLLHKLAQYPFMISTFFDSDLWLKERSNLIQDVDSHAMSMLKSLFMATDVMTEFVVSELTNILQQLHSIAMGDLLHVIETAALSISNVELAVYLLTQVFYQNCQGSVRGDPNLTQSLMNSAIGVALEHIDEAAHALSFEESLILCRVAHTDSEQYIEAKLRIDLLLVERLAIGQHVYFVLEDEVQGLQFNVAQKIDAFVVALDGNVVKFRCLQKLPIYLSERRWRPRLCGSFRQAESMFAALRNLHDSERPPVAVLRGILSTTKEDKTPDVLWQHCHKTCINMAVNNKVTLIQTPPGTPKAALVVSMVLKALTLFPGGRILVTAPADCDVDGILRAYIGENLGEAERMVPVRMATEIETVDHNLLEYVHDMKAGVQQSSSSRLVFMKCSEVGLLSADQTFDLVVVDKACEQPEPMSLVPMLKSERSIVLLGDHASGSHRVRIRNSVTRYHVSMFERLWQTSDSVTKIALAIQNRMHPSINAGVSSLFYGGKVRTAESLSIEPLRVTKFPWSRKGRIMFVQCSSPEDLGRASKCNPGQARLCTRIYDSLLRQQGQSSGSSRSQTHGYTSQDISILSPYLTQVEALKTSLPDAKILTMSNCRMLDVQIAIIVTVRSNLHGHLGLLADMKSLNNALSCARSGAIIIGDRNTLTDQSKGDLSGHEVWKNLLNRCETILLPSSWYM